MDSFVSIVIPLYNSEKYIIETIESVFAQTYKNFEILLVDDGSTDNTREVVKPYIDDKTIRYFLRENGGNSSARNFGIQNAKGDLIALLDHDDLWYPEKLAKQVRLMEENLECGMVHSDSSLIDGNGKLVAYSANKGRQSRNGYVFDEFFNAYYGLVVVSSALIRRKCFDEIGLFDLSIIVTADYELFLKLALKFQIFLIDEPLVKRRLLSTSLIHRTALAIEECEKCLKNLIEENADYFKEHKFDLKRKWSDFYYLSALRLWHAREYAKSREYFSRVIWNKPLALPYFLLLSLPQNLIDALINIKLSKSVKNHT